MARLSKAELTAAADALSAVCERIDAGDLGASPVTRARLEGAALALVAAAGGDLHDLIERLQRDDIPDGPNAGR
jgi:hypothetical protein